MKFIINSLVLLIVIVLVVGWHKSLQTRRTSDDLRTELLRLCSGDKQLAGRLVLREAKRKPGISAEQAIKEAIRSYKRDS